VGVVPLSVGNEGRYGFRSDGLIVRNRRMRTRLSGGVGGAALGPRARRPPIPIGRFFVLNPSVRSRLSYYLKTVPNSSSRHLAVFSPSESKDEHGLALRPTRSIDTPSFQEQSPVAPKSRCDLDRQKKYSAVQYHG